jgi:hypothetical protein
MSDRALPALARAGQPDPLTLAECITTSPPVAPLSPVNEFETALAVLARTANGMETHPHPEVLGEMLIVAAVSTTESYFRSILGALAAVCPVTQDNIRGLEVKLGAALSYPRELIAFSILERDLFSSRGVIAKELKRFLRYDVSHDEEFSGAISGYEVACTVRHASAHWRGFLDSDGLREHNLTRDDGSAHRITPSYSLVQQTLATCDYLVKLANQRIASLTMDRWIERRLIFLDGEHEVSDLARIELLLQVFASDTMPGGKLSAADLMAALVTESASAES